MKLLTSWSNIWHHDELFDIMTNFLTSWRAYDIMTNFWCYLTSWRVLHLLTSKRSCWRLERFDNMTHFVDILTHFLTSWLTFSLDFCHSDCICSLFREQNINKTCFWCYNELFGVMAYFDFISNFWRIFDVMTCCWRHHMFFTPWQTFWRHGESFDVMTSWTFNVMTHLLRLWRHKHKLTTKYIQIHQNDDVVRLCWVGITCIKKHTHNHFIIRPI